MVLSKRCLDPFSSESLWSYHNNCSSDIKLLFTS
ncbi:hypothetical protein [Escherichia phage UPEC01]|nr:hypothetical protein [Escherichia phage UPEC01]